jgi:hypothetical protein
MFRGPVSIGVGDYYGTHFLGAVLSEIKDSSLKRKAAIEKSFQALPAEVMLNIFRRLSAKELGNVYAACHLNSSRRISEIIDQNLHLLCPGEDEASDFYVAVIKSFQEGKNSLPSSNNTQAVLVSPNLELPRQILDKVLENPKRRLMIMEVSEAFIDYGEDKAHHQFLLDLYHADPCLMSHYGKFESDKLLLQLAEHGDHESQELVLKEYVSKLVELGSDSRSSPARRYEMQEDAANYLLKLIGNAKKSQLRNTIRQEYLPKLTETKFQNAINHALDQFAAKDNFVNQLERQKAEKPGNGIKIR